MAMDKIPGYSWQCDISGVKQRLKYLFKTGCFSDITIECLGGFSYQLHRMVLSMCSTVFEAMTFGPMSTLGNEKLIFEDNPEALKYLFAFCYGCDFQCNDIHMVLEVFKIADKYLFNELRSRCVTIIRKLIKPENFKMINEFTVRYGFEDLWHTCIGVMMQDENIVTATSVLMWYSKNSPKDLLTPIFVIDRLVYDTWRNPKMVESSDAIITVLQSRCCSYLQEFAGQVSGDVLSYIPGPLISTGEDHRDPSYAPKLKISLQANNANDVISALYKRYDMYGPEDIGLHIANKDIKQVSDMVARLPCYNCDYEAMKDRFSPGRITLYLSDLTTESFNELFWLMNRLTPDCDKDHKFINSYMFPRCKLKKDDLGTFYKDLFAADEYYLLPSSSIMTMYSPYINMVDENALYDSLENCMRQESREISIFIPQLKIKTTNNEIQGW